MEAQNLLCAIFDISDHFFIHYPVSFFRQYQFSVLRMIFFLLMNSSVCDVFPWSQQGLTLIIVGAETIQALWCYFRVLDSWLHDLHILCLLYTPFKPFLHLFKSMFILLNSISPLLVQLGTYLPNMKSLGQSNYLSYMKWM